MWKPKFVRTIQDALLRAEQVDQERHDAYTKGCLDTATKLQKRVDELLGLVDKMTADNIKNMEAREKTTLEHEQDLRDQYQKQISDVEKRYNENCTECKKVTDAERQRLRDLQLKMADFLHSAEEIYRKLYTQATLIADETGTITQAAVRTVAAKNELEHLKDDMQKLGQATQRYLDAEMGQDHKEVTYAQEGTRRPSIELQPEVTPPNAIGGDGADRVSQVRGKPGRNDPQTED